MIQINKQSIQACEDQLRLAMLNSDVKLLDSMLAPDLIFTNHLGHIMSKNDDLQAHREGMIQIHHLSLSDEKIIISDTTAVVCVRARIKGVFAGETSENDFRFTRVWKQITPEHFQVVAAHACLIQ